LEVLSLTGIEGISLHQPTGVQVIPVEGGLRLVFGHEVTKPVRVRVYNLSGVCIYACQLTSVTSEAFVALPTMLSGVYAVQVETSDRSLQGSELVRLKIEN
jgi:hypothetical protein